MRNNNNRHIRFLSDNLTDTVTVNFGKHNVKQYQIKILPGIFRKSLYPIRCQYNTMSRLLYKIMQ